MESASALAAHVALDKLFTPSLEFHFFWEQLTACNPELSHLIRILLVLVKSASFWCGGGGRLGNGKGQGWLDWLCREKNRKLQEERKYVGKDERMETEKSLERLC